MNRSSGDIEKGQLWFDPKKGADVEVRWISDDGIHCVVCRPHQEPEIRVFPAERFARMELRGRNE